MSWSIERLLGSEISVPVTFDTVDVFEAPESESSWTWESATNLLGTPLDVVIYFMVLVMDLSRSLNNVIKA